MTFVRLSVFAACLLLPPVVRAKTITLPPVKDSRLDVVLPVTAPDARCAAACDATGLLAFGHRTTYKKAHLSIFRLDKEGKPTSGVPALVTLPLPAALAKFPNYPLSMVFHPKLPLLYVWQEIEVVLNGVQPPPAALKELDHLLVYSLEKPVPELILSMGRGPGHAYGKIYGAIAVDKEGAHLYVPNLQDPKTSALQCGRFDLDGDGLPILGDKAGTGTRAARIAALHAAKAGATPIVPQRLTPLGFTYEFISLYNYGSGLGIVPVTKDVAVITGIYHVMSWAPDNRKACLSTFYLTSGYTHNHLAAGHPTLPLIFITGAGTNYGFRCYHSEGTISLLPLKIVLTEASLVGAPVVMGRARMVAFGGQNRVFFAVLDDKGNIQKERRQMVVDNKSVEAMTYSEKHNLLYVAVEVSK